MKALQLELTNAYAMSILHPDTFEYPDEQSIAMIAPDDFVKICYEEDENMAERFWCKVVKVDHSKKIIIAAVANELINYDIPLDTLLRIQFKNIYDIISQENE
jgi:hypothetical protein